jgi:hypothetical protein
MEIIDEVRHWMLAPQSPAAVCLPLLIAGSLAALLASLVTWLEGRLRDIEALRGDDVGVDRSRRRFRP